MRKSIGLLAMLAGALASLVLSTLVHLDTRTGRRAFADALERLVDGEIQGSLRIGSIDELSADRIVARDVLVSSAEGRPALRLDHVELDPAPSRLFGERTIAVERARIRGARLWMIEDRDGLRLEVAFDSEAPPSPRGGPPTTFIDLDGIVFSGLESEWRLGGGPPFTIGDASGLLRVRTDERGDVVARFDRIEGLARFDLPLVDVTAGVRTASGRVHAGYRRVGAFDIELDVAGSPLHVALDLLDGGPRGIEVRAETGTDGPSVAWLAILGLDLVTELDPRFGGDIEPAGAIGTDRPARRRGDPHR